MRLRFVLLLGLCFVRAVVAEDVWIDTDVSIGSPIREVDDAFALVLAFHSPEIRIVGLSTTYGNAPLGQTTRVAKDLVARFGAPAGLTVDAVFSGGGSASDLGRRSNASEALAAALKKQKLTYIALGPLTNLATFLRLHPDQAKRVERVIFVGGQTPGTSLAFGPTRSFPIHDANVFKDPAATEALLKSSVPVTLVPVMSGSNLSMNQADLRRLDESGEAGRYLSRRSKIWLWFWTGFVKANGGPLFDALAIIPATRPKLLSMEERYALMDRDRNLMVRPRMTAGARAVRYCTRFAPGLKGVVLERVSSGGTRKGDLKSPRRFQTAAP